jgi:hypothetical protein
MDRESGEPPLSGITISVAQASCETGADGTCTIAQVPQGERTVTVSDFGGRLKWILPSSSEAIPIQNGLRINVQSAGQISAIPLAEGRYVLPFPKPVVYEIYTWYDHHRGKAVVSNWLGEEDTSPGQHGDYYYSFPTRVEDEHCAIDYVFREPVPVIASDAGTVIEIILDAKPDAPEDHIVLILNDLNVRLNYGHVDVVDGLQVGSRVARGEVIGHATAHGYPRDWEPEFQGFQYMIHQGFEPLGMGSHCNALDPFSPSLWTTSDYQLARVQVE